MTMKAARMTKPNSFWSQRPGDKALDVIIWVLVLLAVAVTLYPFLYVLSVSISDGGAVARGDVVLLPKGFSLDAFGMDAPSCLSAAVLAGFA